MFFLIDLWKNVTVKPHQLGPQYARHVEEILKEEVEGICNSKYGYILSVLRIFVREKGWIQDGTGHIIVPVKYQAIVFKPFRNEVLDATVTAINELGFYAQGGLLRIFVSRNSIPDYFEFKDSVYTDGETTIEVSSDVRMRLQGVKFEPSGIIAVATINQDYLGPITSTGIAE